MLYQLWIYVYIDLNLKNIYITRDHIIYYIYYIDRVI